MSRAPLSRERVIEAATHVADAGGITAVTMRAVARELGVEAMSLYHHVPTKEALIRDLADAVFAEIDLPVAGEPWREQMSRRCHSAREVLARHPWGLGLIESQRQPGPSTITHHERVLACLRHGGLSPRLAAHAFSVLDSYVYGFVLTELSLPFAPGEGAEDMLREMALSQEEFPYLVEMALENVIGKDYAYADEFNHGLDLILDALEQRLGRE